MPFKYSLGVDPVPAKRTLAVFIPSRPGLAFLFPAPRGQGGLLHAEVVNNFGIVLILFLQGLSLSLEKAKNGARDWRLHLVLTLEGEEIPSIVQVSNPSGRAMITSAIKT